MNLKRRVLLVFSVSFFLGLMVTQIKLHSTSLEPPPGYANNPPYVVNCAYCHTCVPSHDTTNFILQIGPDTAHLSNVISGFTHYTPGQTYVMRLTGTRTSVVYGFELTAEDTANGGFNVVDNFSALDTVNTTTTTDGYSNYITHHNATTTANGNNQWTFNWVAPSPGAYQGPVTFYYSGNDGSGPSTNQPGCCDQIYVAKKLIYANPVNGVNNLNSEISGFNIYPALFANQLQVEFGLKTGERITAEIISMDGRVAETVLDKSIDAGRFNYNFDLSSLASGIYLFKLRAGNSFEVRKIVKQ
jgi:Reeler domain/Secretion system C-terminal sorting domain